MTGAQRERLLHRLKAWSPSDEYFALTLKARRGQIETSAFSHWVGPSEHHPLWEIRQASLIRPGGMVEMWDGVRQRWVVVSNRDTLRFWLAAGGNALVLRELAERDLPFMIGPRESAPSGPIGFCRPSDPSAPRRRISRGVGLAVLKRDGFRCSTCGVTRDLTKHHLIPVRDGGPDVEDNLVTLCRACHEREEEGGQPMRFYSQVLDASASSERHQRGVEAYRRLVRRNFAAPSQAEKGFSGTRPSMPGRRTTPEALAKYTEGRCPGERPS